MLNKHNINTNLAITGISNASDIALMKWFLFGFMGLSLTVRPCTPIAAIPVAANFLHNTTVSLISGNTRILHVTGILTAETTAERIAQAFSGHDKRAAPIPPLSEKSFGQPMFMSIPATSCSLTEIISIGKQCNLITTVPHNKVCTHTTRAALTARSGSLVPI